MNRFFAYPENIKGDIIHIKSDQARHAFLVLRLKPGAVVIVFDGSGRLYFGEIRSLSCRQGTVLITKTELMDEKKIKITITAAIPKQSKFEDIIDKATQLGVYQIIPLITQRTIAKINSEKAVFKKNRWQKIALSAAQQSGNCYIPEIRPICSFDQVIETIPSFDIAVIAALHKDAVPIKSAILGKKPKSAIVFIGPEGDFSEEEVEKAKIKGASVVCLGKNVLRCETAVIKILSILNYEWEE